MNDTTVQLPVFRVAGLSRDSATDTLAADIEEMRRLWLEGSLKNWRAVSAVGWTLVAYAFRVARQPEIGCAAKASSPINTAAKP